MLEDNRILFYSSAESAPMDFIGIGSCENDPQEPEPYVLPGDQSEEGWKNFFDANGSNVYPIQALNYMLLMNNPEECLPECLLHNFENNKSQIESIVHNWFEPDSAIFKFLDLVNIDLSDDINEVIEISEFETKYHFKDGSSIIINENETVREQYFIPSSLQEALIEDLRLLPILLII